MIKTVVVTGSSGFIGRKLCLLLRKNHFNVIELDLEKKLDIKDFRAFSSLPDFDFIIHLAARSFVPDSFKEPLDFYRTNIDGTLNVLESARQKKAKVIFFSSYLYGSPEYLPVDEEHNLNPHNPYANSKMLGEKLCEAYFKDFNVPVMIFRPFNIYGSGQNENFLIPTIVSQLKNKEIQLLDSKPKRDYIHASDVVHAVYCAITSNIEGFECFNLGSGESYSVEHIAKELIKLSDANTELIFSQTTRENEVLDCYANIDKAKVMLNWKPEVTLIKGLELIINNNN